MAAPSQVPSFASLKARAKTLNELADNAAFYAAERPLSLNDKAAKLLSGEAPRILAGLMPELSAQEDWSDSALEAVVRGYAERQGVKLGQVAQPLRAALTGSNTSPGIFEVMTVLGREESLGRIGDQAG